MNTELGSPLVICLALLAAWGLIGLAGMLRPASLRFAGRTLFPLGALCGAALAVVAGLNIAAPPEQIVLLIGLPSTCPCTCPWPPSRACSWCCWAQL